MPIIEDQNRDRVAEALEELCMKLEEQLTTPPEPPVVNVEAPKLTVPPAAVNVTTPAEKTPSSWTFDVVRDSNDRIQKIVATPKN